MRTIRIAIELWLALALGAAAARAADVGEVAVIEDTSGAIDAAGWLVQDYLAKATCAFYQSHGDQYDALIFFTTIPQGFMSSTPAAWVVRSPGKGVGLDLWLDGTQAFCSTSGRLRHTIRMADLAALPDSPDGLYKGYVTTFTGIEVLAHEMGHQWMAWVSFMKGDGVRHCLLRAFVSASGTGQAACDGYAGSDFNGHWSYYFNNESLMLGNSIEDLGGGKFRINNHSPKYTAFDQYLMGLRDRSEVGPLFLVDKGDPAGIAPATPPAAPGQPTDLTGTRLDLTVDDVIRAEGPLDPARQGCHWKTAFAIVHAAGKPPTAEQITKVDAYRKRWETYYPWATDQRGSVDTTLAGSGAGTAGCPASGIQPDRGATAADRGTTDRGAASAEGARGDQAAAASSGCGCGVAERPVAPLATLTLLACLAVLRRGQRRCTRK